MPLDLHLVDLDQTARGFRGFISCWLARTEDLVYVVDPGPTSTIPHLVAELRARGVEQVDYALLTHIHLDHAGGTAAFLQAFPEARVYCPPRGRRHLVDPARLWAGSVGVLGDVARMYGEPGPVPEEALVYEEHLSELGITVHLTPGHASHHACLVHEDVLFAGEVFGTTTKLPSGRPYLRPATPPRLLADVAQDSMHRMGALGSELRVAFAHHGLDRDPAVWAARASAQLRRWISWGREAREAGGDWQSAVWERALAEDPLCGGERWLELAEDVREREAYFARNTLEGIAGWLERP